MKLIQLIIAISLFSFLSHTYAAEGLIVHQSAFHPKQTMDKFETLAKQKGLNIFARINHSAGAQKIGKQLPATELLIFGNPKGGTPLMECAQTAGIDLPLKVLVWQDKDNKVWLGYNDMNFIANRHNIKECPAINKLQQALAGLVKQAITTQ
ncbi:DUF302 domain-containing protein [Thiomicrorhabdus lithotrophica]|uniref:DUF302 domain-containing protein n=1 Tax=Thiomicrorhabdus lithotrophica TaxID=2949997 RepID=A0ABY8CC46_9GAMM|nr:DUF302 domain-containing protein [Thiomicrorhabdus lithotrophica]WEJ63563.1 DUF302 domain-containing protein [Thiomicrorhabdus lithotrophica]